MNSSVVDPRLHTHVILPNWQPRADAKPASIDPKSMHHGANTAGSIYQATLRHELQAERGFEWGTPSMSTPTWPRSIAD